MANPFAAKTAWRYLFARKSHSAVNLISNVAMCGIAVATMAMVCVLSVFNGFQDFSLSNASRVLPDVMVAPAQGKTIASADSLASALAEMPEVALAMPAVSDNALLAAGGLQLPVNLLGVEPQAYAEITGIKELLMPGSRYELAADGEGEALDTGMPQEASDEPETAEAEGDFSESQLFIPASQLYSDNDDSDPLFGGEEDALPENFALVSIGVLQNLVDPDSFSSPDKIVVPPALGVNLFVPRRTSTINPANPASSFLIDSIGVSGAFASLRSEMDEKTVVVDIELARRLLEYTAEATHIYLKAAPGIDDSRLRSIVAERLGDGFRLSDRLGQQTFQQNMMAVEKWITFLLLSCILVIASFNVVSTLAMLIVEKRSGIRTLRSLGASQRSVGAIFAWESFYVCLLGAVAGILLGLLLSWLQMQYGIIGIGDRSESLILKAYPASVRLSDLPAVLAPIALIAALTSAIAALYARRLARTI